MSVLGTAAGKLETSFKIKEKLTGRITYSDTSAGSVLMLKREEHYRRTSLV